VGSQQWGRDPVVQVDMCGPLSPDCRCPWGVCGRAVGLEGTDHGETVSFSPAGG